ncbi:MAG: Wzz/FepE/Etk N-terminal domain-containing protein [Caldilineaceae bacterium]
MTKSTYHIGSGKMSSDSPVPEEFPPLSQPLAWNTLPNSPVATSNGWEIGQYLQMIGRWLWLILLCALLAGGCSFGVSHYLMTPIFRASTTLMVKTLNAPNAAGSRVNDYDTFLASADMTLTYKELAQRRPVADAAAQSLGLASNQLYGNIAIAVIPKTPLLVLSFESAKPDKAAAVTNAVATALIQMANDQQWIPGRELVVMEKAELPNEPVSPRVWLNTLVAVVVGGALALAFVFTLEYLRFIKRT